MNLSLKQQLPPSSNPATSGGFLGRYPTNPSKLRSLREPLDISSTKNGPSTKLVIDMERAKSPTALQRRITLEDSMKTASPHAYQAFNPAESTVLSNISKSHNKISKQKNSLIGGLSGALLTNRSLEALKKVVARREDAECQTEVALYKMEFDNIQDYQTWTKSDVDPLLRDLKKAILSNRPVNLGLFIEAYGKALAEGKDLPECQLFEEMWVNPPPETLNEGISLNHSLKTLDKKA
jgi:hypothetical protein